MDIKKIAIIALSILLIAVAVSAVVVFLNDSAITDAYDQNLVNTTNSTVISGDNNNDIIIDENINNNIENNINSNAINNDSTNANSNVNKNTNNISEQQEPEETTIEKEKVVSKTTKLSWIGMSLLGINSDFNNTGIYYTDFEVEKQAKIIVANTEKNLESNNDEKYVSAGDIIEYTLKVKNTGTLPLENLLVVDKMLGIEKNVTLPVGYEYEEVFEYIITEQDVINSIENDSMIYNKLLAKYQDEEKETTTETNVNLEYTYTVEHYQQNLDRKNYTLADTDYLSGMINDSTEATSKEYIGFKVNSFEQEIIKGDNSTIVKIYYDRLNDLSYTVNYLEQGTDKVLATAKTVNNQTFGTEITENAIDIEGYNKVEPTTETITLAASGNVINFYYTARTDTGTIPKTDIGYVVNYIEQGTNNVLADAKIVKNQKVGVEVTENAIDIEGYNKIEPTIETIILSEDENVINFYYTARTDISYTVNYLEQGTDKILATAKTVNDQTFGTEITENAIDIEGYNKVEPTTETITLAVSGNVINFYYTKADFAYTVEYYYDNVIDNQLTETYSAKYQAVIADYDDKKKTGYKFSKTENLPLTISSNATENVIKVYYERNTFEYIVEYYYDNVKDSTKTERNSALFGTEITTYPNKVKAGYKYEREEGTPLTISADTRENVISVYYVKDNFGYKVEYYYDNVKDDSKTYTGAATEFGSVITTYPDKNIEGYKLDKTENLPLTISENTLRNIISVYYIPRTDISYTVNYLEQGTNKVLATAKTVNNQTFGTEVTENAIDIEGYNKVEPITETITLAVSENVINFYYTARTDISYTVNYLEQGTNKVLATAKTVNNQTFGTEVTENAIDIEGYNKVEPITETITLAVSGNVINFYYTIASFVYTVEYYYDGVKNNANTGNLSALFGTEITSYPDKADGYNFKSDTLPLVISTIAANNIIRVDYVSNANVTVEKVAPATANVGDTIEYTITVRNSGGTEDTVDVIDTLPAGVTYVSSTNSGNYNSANRTVTWNNITVPGVELAGNDRTVSLNVTVKIDKDQYGEVITNNVSLSNGKTSSATTTISEKTIIVNEMKEGQTGKSANIILIMDLSSSMNKTVSGQSYTESDAGYVAPSDVSKTRIYAAKQAAVGFINEIYSGANSSDVRVSVITFNTNSSGTDDTEVLTTECTENHNHYYERDCQYATDGKYYNVTTQSIKIGTQVLTVSGTDTKASSSNYQGLITSINNLSIGSRTSNYGTYIKPAISQAEKLVDEYKQLNNNENIVIILSDGEPNDVSLNGGKRTTSATNAISKLKSKLATVYSIGFGSDASNSSKNSYKILQNFSTDGNVLTAGNAATLAAQFKTILESLNTTSNKTTVNGVLTFTAAKELAYPVNVYYDEKLLFSCESARQLSNYNLTYDSTTKQLTWDINAYLRNNSEVADFSGKLEFTYYIKR